MLTSLNGEGKKEKAGVYDDEDPPVPIPNTEVKLISVENTWRAAARENRTVPTQEKTDQKVCLFFILVWAMGLEEGGLAERQGKKYAGGMFFSPGESPFLSGRILLWMWTGRKLAIGGVK